MRNTAVALMVVLAVCEVVLLQQYVGVVKRNAQLQIELEFARGAATLANAQAQRCDRAETR